MPTIRYDDREVGKGLIRGFCNGASNADKVSLKDDNPQVVLFWGVHKRRQVAGKAERRTISGVLEFFRKLGIRIRLRVILADEHGRFNRIENANYLDSVASVVQEAGSEVLWLSDLYREGGLSASPPPVDESVAFPNDTLRASLIRGAENRDGDEKHARRYVALRMQEREIICTLMGDSGLFLVVGGPEYAPLFEGISPIVFVRAKAKSGAGWVDKAPWIQ